MSSSDVSYGSRRDASPDGATTAVLAPVEPSAEPRGAGVREHVAALDGTARLAWIGALLSAVAFLLLPYAGSRGSAVEIGGRLWWRPVLAVVAALLVTAATRRYGDDATRAEVAAVAVAAAAVTEAGLFGLVSRAGTDLRVGFFAILLGAVLVLVAAVRVALRRTR